MFEGRLDDAAQLLEARLAKEATSHSESTAKAWAMLAEVRSTRGDKVGAKEAALHVAVASDASTLFRAARVLARVAPPKQAAEAAESLLGHPGLHARLFSALVTAESRRVEGKVGEAVQVLEEARSPRRFPDHSPGARAGRARTRRLRRGESRARAVFISERAGCHGARRRDSDSSLSPRRTLRARAGERRARPARRKGGLRSLPCDGAFGARRPSRPRGEEAGGHAVAHEIAPVG